MRCHHHLVLLLAVVAGTIDAAAGGSVRYFSPGSPLRTMAAGSLHESVPVKVGASRVVCVSDIHGRMDVVVVPKCDVLIVAGDLGGKVSRWRPKYEEEVVKLRTWLERQPCRDAVLIGGNHDKPLEKLGAQRVRELFARSSKTGPRLHYLQKSSCVTASGLKVYGNPTSFAQWWSLGRHVSFQEKIKESDRIGSDVFRDLPAGYDIIMTHESSRTEVVQSRLAAVRPSLHVGGHTHSAYGAGVLRSGIASITPCIMNQRWQPVNLPIVIDLVPRRS